MQKTSSQVARWISILGHPFVMAALLVAVSAMRRSPGSALRATLLVGVGVLAPIALLMVRQVRRGRWADVDASNASERPVLFAVAIAGLFAILGWLLLRDPQSFLVRGVAVVVLFLLLSSILTRWIKLSLHVAFAALTATALTLSGSAAGIAAIAAIPLIWWSRLAMGRHRPRELAAGLLLGAVTGAALVLL